MICARLNKTKSGHLCLSVRGHAGAGEVGQDIVCASVSILAYTVAQTVKDAYAAGKLKGHPNILLHKGSSTVSCTPHECFADEMEMAFRFAQTGLNLLQHNYPQYVALTMFGKA